MLEHQKSFLRDLGTFIRIPAILGLPSIIVAAIYQEWFALPAFGILILISFGIGQFLVITFKHSEETYAGSSFLLVALAWFLIPVLGTIPYYGVAFWQTAGSSETAKFLVLHSAFFESMSGFTGTGLSMTDAPDLLPKCLQWWRSLTEWVGGLGIIFLATEVFNLKHNTNKVYQAEAMNWQQKDDPKFTIRKIWWIYLSYTFLAMFSFFLAGMPVWQAINHGLTAISTGGFAVTRDSFASYSATIKTVAIVIMIIGSLSFRFHYFLLIKRNLKVVWQQSQLHYYAVLMLTLLFILIFINTTTPLVDNMFQAASALGTCGFNSVKISNWSMPALFILILAMNLGGNSNSTTGGIKTARLLWMIKVVSERMRITFDQNRSSTDIKFIYNGNEIEADEAYNKFMQASLTIFLWIIVLAVGTFLLVLLLNNDYALTDILFEASSALNNVGLSSGITSHTLDPKAKWILIMMMWMGRLEIFAVLLLFTLPFQAIHSKK